MGTVVAHMTMSLDGFIAFPDDSVGPLFDWYAAGPITTPSSSEQITFQTDAASAEFLRSILDSAGALICGRRLFELTDAWGGRHPIGCPVVVVTHSVPSGWPEAGEHFSFVTTGVTDAVTRAQEIAGPKLVVVSTPTLTRQCLDLGLLDEVAVSLAPVLLGSGIPFFSGLAQTPVMLDDPEVVVGLRATHLRYRVRR